MSYVDGFVLVVPKKKLATYRKMAREGGQLWKKHGAVSYFECVGDDMDTVKKWGGLPFPKMAKCKPSEVVWYSFIVYKSKAERNRINAKIHKEMAKKYPDHKPGDMPFDMKRMAYGGFKAVVEL